jgi:hypothetical protein
VWPAVRQAALRPYPVTAPMVLLVSLVPFYLVISNYARGGPAARPEVALDRLLPLVPEWSLVYGALYAFLIVLPVFVVQPHELVRRTVWAYITVWSLAYVVFLLYPTIAPRPEAAAGEGFGAWGLRALYDADPPYNCFPSIHVALATLLTKQHYVADAIGGAALAFAANALWLRGYPRAGVPGEVTDVAPALAVCVGAFIAACLAVAWAGYHAATAAGLLP